jgi:hypothetical protein
MQAACLSRAPGGGCALGHADNARAGGGARASGGARVLSRRRRIRRLEFEVAEAWASQDELRRRLELFERIAAAAGADLARDPWWREACIPEPVPPTLVAAARDAGPRPRAVCLSAAGTDVIAVADEPGDAADWWAAVSCVAAQDDEAGPVTRILHRTLPPGLIAVARRGDDDEFAVVLSDALDPGRQRDAVRTVIRAARGQHRVPALMPVPVAASVSAARSVAGRAGQQLRAHLRLAAAAFAVVAGLVAAISLITLGPHAANSTAGGPAARRQPGPSVSQSRASGAPPAAATPGAHAGSRPGTSGPSQPGTRVVAVRNPSGPARPSPAPQSTPSQSPAPTQSAVPQPSPTPTPGTSSSGCVQVLSIQLCV